MVRFTLFGIPVEIQPWFWLTIALLSGALFNPDPAGIQYGLIFILAATVSILVHELGHALTGRRLGGGYPKIVLWAMGGLAYNEGGRFTKSGRFWMIAAGPGAGFILGGLVFLIMVAVFGLSDAANLAGWSLIGMKPTLSAESLEFALNREPLMSLFRSMLWINFWWGVMNLLPVLPLDGGQITQLFVKPQKLVHQIAIAAAVATAVVGLVWRESLFMALLFGYLAWQNYQAMQSLYRR
ncbi:site-2 protease family protein [Luteolibacter flavescens]|uniref:Site-2 protease family protein n=1 Tax=Luteolibacter flavescens TaxID=1859460 RepID=A0ABT3FJ60_9BACT|nr:site-2 protease family protein [Luteolibacter flavescens]MCW1883607.1 site-2 protease family protein [Luteolibacter flavescens]